MYTEQLIACIYPFMLRECLRKIGTEYTSARLENFTGHPLGQYVRHDAPKILTDSLGEFSTGLLFKGSIGQGIFADIPWLAVFDPLVTTGARQGYYLCYLFSPETNVVHLSLNQGTTRISDEFGREATKIMKNRAAYMAARLEDFACDLNVRDIAFGSNGKFSRDYEAAHAIGKSYNIDRLPDENELTHDLILATQAYRALTFRGGLDASDNENNEMPAGQSVSETRRYSMHRRLDRSAGVPKKVKEELGSTCQACGLNFEEKYGELGDGYIEAHHLTPLSSLEEGKPVTHVLAKDFAVLCSNCHSMIHRLPDVSDLEELRRRIKWQEML